MAKLTAKARKAIPKKDFALPGGRYPVEDRSHARSALARVSQHGTPAEKAKVRAKVQEKFPGIGEEGGKGMKKKETKVMVKAHERGKTAKGAMRKHNLKHDGHDAIGSQEGRMMAMGRKGRG
jgi:hypothetical protein